MGFAAGLRAGNSVVSDWVDSYRDAKEEKISGGLREAMNEAQQDRMVKDEEGNMLEQAGMDILNSSPAEITTTVMNQFKASGGTVDESTWNLVNGIVGEATGLVGRYKKSQQDREIAGAREDNIRNTIFNRDRRAESQIAKNERWTPPHGRGNVSVTDAYGGEDYSTSSSTLKSDRAWVSLEDSARLNEAGVKEPLTKKEYNLFKTRKKKAAAKRAATASSGKTKEKTTESKSKSYSGVFR